MSRAATKRSSKAAPSSVDDDVRSYDEMKYWDDRYQHHLAKQAPAAASSGAATAAPPAATPAAAASSSKKISKKRDRSPSKGEDSSASLSAAATSDDITAEWYYSYADLQHILLPAFEGIDRSGSVLDIGCGVSNFFDDLRKPLSTAQPKSTKAKKGKQEDATEEISGGAGFTGDFIGLDYSPTVIAHLRQQTPETAANKLHWVCGDACHLLPEAEEQDAAASQSSRKKGKKSSSASPSSSSSSAPPPLSPSVRALFRPESFALILDKATSDGMLCSDHTARLTPLIYANVARLLAPNGLFVIASVNEPDSGWFGEYVVSQLIEHGGDCQWQIEVHTPSNYKDGEDGAPNVYVIKKAVHAGGRAVRNATREQREPYTIKQMTY